MTRLTRICVSLAIVSLMFAGQSYAEVDPETLVGMWLFDEGAGDVALDSSGNGNDGTLNGPTWTNVSKFGGALEFNGADSYIEFATGESMKIPHLTFMAWFNTRKLDGYGHIFQTGNDWDDMAGYVFRVHQDGYVQSALAFAPGNTATWLSGPAVEADTWYHMVLTYDGTTAILYLDGENVATGGGQGEIMYDDQPVRIGVLSQTIGSAFDGYIDEVALFDVALAAEDIQAIMDDGLLAIIGGYPLASAPDPEDGALHPDVWVSLAWKPGDFAVSHNVYMGDNFDDVNEGTGDTSRGNTDQLSLIVGFVGYPYPEGLVPGTTYYWRVDEVNDADPDSPWKGDVWSFFVPPKKSYDPSPTDGTMFIDPSVTLAWTAGFRAGLQHMYFGDNSADVEAGTGGTYKGHVTSTSYVPGTLELDKTYYWRVDSTGGTYGDITGDVWSFTTTLPGLGTIIFERWENFSGTVPELKSDPRFPSDPDVTEVVTQFEWNGPDVENYGARIYGWVYAPATGDYTFWLTTDDQGELWLSGDDDASNAKLIARESSWRDYNSWGSGEEQSDPIPLVAGNKYYIEALWQEGIGGDHCQVAWQGPGVPTRTIIPGSNLSQYEPVTAFGPKPGNGAENVTQTPTLEWKPGIQAASHQVYFGTDEDAVKNANTSLSQYRDTRALGSESFNPGKLDWETTYYWRIDEVNNLNPDSPWVGGVWSFKTAGFLIVDDMEDYDTINAIWANWHDGLGYIDTGGVSHPGNGSGSEVGDPGTGTYTEETIVHSGGKSMPYWYNNSGSTGKFNYSEAKLTLSAGKRDWTDGGVKALSLWLQGRPGSVGSFVESPPGTYTMTGSGADIWNTSDEFHFAYKMLSGQGSIVVKVESLSNTHASAKAGVMIRDTLDADSKYAIVAVTPGSGVISEYRADTGIGAEQPASQTGIAAPYWVKLERDLGGNFTASHSTNGSTWEALGVPENIQMGSSIYIGLPLTSHNAALTCQAVLSNVTITGNVSGAWTNQDIGIQSNDPEPMYVAVANSTGPPAVVYHDDPSATQMDTWTEWNIDLKDFQDKGINLTDVDSVALGFGDRNNPQVGGAGKMYFDDVRLYLARYVPGMGTPLASDFNGDGVVDYRDLEIMAGDWLATDSFTAAAVSSGVPIGWWKFDNNTNDSAGNNHGIANGLPGYVAGMDGQAISLDGVDDYVSVAGVGISGNAPRTIAGWAKADVTEMNDWTNVFGFTGPAEDGRHFDIQYMGDTDSSTQGYYGIHIYGDEYDIIPVDLDWHHLGATYDGTMTYYYGDGVLIGSATIAIDTPGAVRMGKREDNDNYFPGSVDDVRIYNYVLSDAELAGLVDDTPGDGQLYVPVPSAANIYDDEPEGSRSVNFKDFAVLMDQWLEEQVWPEW